MTGLEQDDRDAFRSLASVDWQQRQAAGGQGAIRPFLPPDELTPRLRAGRAFVRLRQWEQAAANFTQALAVKDNAFLRQERGDVYALQGRWMQAAADFTRALELQPDDHWLWYRALVLHAQLGNKEEYRRLSHKMLERFGRTTDLHLAERTVKACSLLSGVFEDRQKLSELADMAVTRQPNHPSLAWFCLAKGLAEYRPATMPTPPIG